MTMPEGHEPTTSYSAPSVEQHQIFLTDPRQQYIEEVRRQVQIIRNPGADVELRLQTAADLLEMLAINALMR
ncbi:hypothetical protein SEA_PUPPER_38 [Gordonia phage Pupper]|uniref:Uncharacterized protein n=1 Tax=Gordonia phage Pupper TaxID=2571249 RepID=A0A4Y6EKF8_9CAUD|nr:hypothetical protein KHQ83_gp038 [Gordonia phage Pupper]QDF18525.1 hypothetical protein SEA_PUPPER_38 [Gordonia phage Pupper]QDF18758.1 hypothetical protein SEA_SCENTAE_38 [Gordonia phage SCentae]